MFHLTAPITKRQLELMQTRKRLEQRLCYDSYSYGVAAKVEKIDAELETIEHSKGQKEVGAWVPPLPTSHRKPLTGRATA